PERQRADRVEPPWLRCPQTVKPVPPFFQSQDALRIEGQLSYHQNTEPAFRRGRVGPLPKAAVILDLIHMIATRGMESHGMRYGVARAIRIQAAAQRLEDGLVVLGGMVDPLTGNPAGATRLAMAEQL